MPSLIERRVSTIVRLEIRQSKSEPAKIVGHAAVFNQWSENLGGFKEKIAPGAFAKSIKSDDVRALFNHNPDFVLGRTASKTLRLSEDGQGLAMECDPPDTQMARDVMELIRRGDISQMSFGFKTISDQWTRGADGQPDERTLIEAQLYDVSPVTYPAYPQTDVNCRALEDILAAGRAQLGIALPKPGIGLELARMRVKAMNLEG